MFKYSDSNKRYHTLDYYYKKKFNSKVFKVSLNAGFSCPNLDGTLSKKGCIFCSKLGSGDYAGDIKDEIITQFDNVKKVMENKWPNSKYIGYFQARTNTYASVNILKEKFEPILKLNNVVGISIATRPDCIDDNCLDYLIDLNKRTFLTIELGLQTVNEETLKLINRCHTVSCFTDCVKKLRENNINVVAHIINGLPYETKEMMIETVNYLNKLDIQGIKIHMLHIIKDTDLDKLYKASPFKVLTKNEFVNIVCDQLEFLDEKIVIHRVTSDPKVEDLVEPTWLVKKFDVLNSIDKEMKLRNSFQGIKKDA